MDVTDSDSIPIVGRVVRILRGRDRDSFAVVIDQVNEKYVLIADGDKRKFDRPKRKNKVHLQFLDQIADEVVEQLHETGRVSNGKLRYVLGKLAEQHTEVQRKGE